MSRKNAGRPLVLLSLLLQAIANVTLAIPLTNSVSLLNNTIIPTALTAMKEFITQNVTSPGTSPNMIDYHVAGTPLILCITETGLPFTEAAVNRIIDYAIRKVVAKINAGSGNELLEQGKFWLLSPEIDMRITALPDARFTYFLLGKQFRPR